MVGGFVEISLGIIDVSSVLNNREDAEGSVDFGVPIVCVVCDSLIASIEDTDACENGDTEEPLETVAVLDSLKLVSSVPPEVSGACVLSVTSLETVTVTSPTVGTATGFSVDRESCLPPTVVSFVSDVIFSGLRVDKTIVLLLSISEL